MGVNSLLGVALHMTEGDITANIYPLIPNKTKTIQLNQHIT
ncbi:hypothetical protein [Piscirickettsia salmonis]|nr:hypothetical protein [Piscirickettsia salmonis]